MAAASTCSTRLAGFTLLLTCFLLVPPIAWSQPAQTDQFEKIPYGHLDKLGCQCPPKSVFEKTGISLKLRDLSLETSPKIAQIASQNVIDIQILDYSACRTQRIYGATAAQVNWDRMLITLVSSKPSADQILKFYKDTPRPPDTPARAATKPESSLAAPRPPTGVPFDTTASATANREQIKQVITPAQPQPRVLFSGNDELRIRRRTGEVAAILSRQIDQPDFAKQAWTTAQIATAISALQPVRTGMEAYFNAVGDTTCSCWHKWDRARNRRGADPSPNQHLVATSWVAMSLATNGQVVPPKTLEFLLKTQTSSGWWPLYPADAIDENASTFATATCVLALDVCLKSGMIDPSMRSRTQRAASVGRQWLWTVRPDNGALWKDYPVRTVGASPSLGISGLVLHVLNSEPDSRLSGLNKVWLQALPDSVPLPDTHDTNPLSILNHGTETGSDDTRHYAYPWLLVATIDAMDGALESDQERGRLFIQKAATDELFDGIDKLAASPNAGWIAAESTIALRYSVDAGYRARFK